MQPTWEVSRKGRKKKIKVSLDSGLIWGDYSYWITLVIEVKYEFKSLLKMKAFPLERKRDYNIQSLSVQVWPVPVLCLDNSVFLKKIKLVAKNT